MRYIKDQLDSTAVACLIVMAIVPALIVAGIYGTAVRRADLRLASTQKALRVQTARYLAADGARERMSGICASQSAQIRDLRMENRALREDNAALTRAAAAPKHRATPRRVRRYTGSIPALIRRVAASKGITGAEADALVELARRESTFRPTATNGRCMGLFQLKTTDARWSDPAWNTARAIGYIRSRYGTPSAAIAHHNAHHWY